MADEPTGPGGQNEVFKLELQSDAATVLQGILESFNALKKAFGEGLHIGGDAVAQLTALTTAVRALKNLEGGAASGAGSSVEVARDAQGKITKVVEKGITDRDALLDISLEQDKNRLAAEVAAVVAAEEQKTKATSKEEEKRHNAKVRWAKETSSLSAMRTAIDQRMEYGVAGVNRRYGTSLTVDNLRSMPAVRSVTEGLVDGAEYSPNVLAQHRRAIAEGLRELADVEHAHLLALKDQAQRESAGNTRLNKNVDDYITSLSAAQKAHLVAVHAKAQAAREAAATERLNTSGQVIANAQARGQRRLEQERAAFAFGNARLAEIDNNVRIREAAYREQIARWRGSAFAMSPAQQGPLGTHAVPLNITGAFKNNLSLQPSDLRETEKASQGIAASWAMSAVNLAKFVVLYRIIRDMTMAIERGIGAIVSKGLEYTKAQELQLIGLQATLAEHSIVTDLRDKEITGAQKINALQEVSKQQWLQLQSASLKVVGQTEDLMMLYSSILPFAGRLGASMEEVQQMTESTAIAASLMGVSFNDARTAIVSMLQGRSLQRNRLVTLLGISKDELTALKDTPELFTRIQNALAPFAAMGGAAQNTLGALTETFAEFVGIIGKSIEAPFVAGFKSFVKAVQDFMFESTGQLVLKPEIANTLSMISKAMADAVKPFVDFGKELRDSDGQVASFIYGLSNIVKGVSQFAVWIVKGAMALASMVDYVRSLDNWFTRLTLVVLVGASALSSLSNWFVTIAKSGGLMGNVIALVCNNLLGMQVKTEMASGAMAGLARSWKAFGASIGTGAIWAVALSGISLLIGKVLDLVSAWGKARDAKAAYDSNDPTGYYANREGLDKAPDMRDRTRNRLESTTAGLELTDRNIAAGAGAPILQDAKNYREYLAAAKDNLKTLNDTVDAETRRAGLIAAVLGHRDKIEKLTKEQLEDAKKQNLISQTTGKLDQKRVDSLTALQGKQAVVLEGAASAAQKQSDQIKTETEKAEERLNSATARLRAAEADRAKLQAQLDKLPAPQANAQGIIPMSWTFTANHYKEALANVNKEIAVLTPKIDAMKAIRGIQDYNPIGITLRDPETPEKPEKGMHSSADEEIRILRERIDQKIELLKDAAKEEVDLGTSTLTKIKENFGEQLGLEAQYLAGAKALREKERKDFEASLDPKKNNTQARKEFDARMVAQEEGDMRAFVRKLMGFQDQGRNRIKADAKELRDAQEQYAAEFAKVFGGAAETVEARYSKMVGKMLETIADPVVRKAEQDRLMALLPYAKAQAELEEALKKVDVELSSNTDGQRLLTQQYEAGVVSVDAYITRSKALKDIERDTLLRKQALLAQAIAAKEASPVVKTAVDLSEIAALKAQYADIASQLTLIDSLTTKIKDATDAWRGLLGGVGDFFGQISASVGKVFDVIAKGGGVFTTIFEQFNKFKVKVADLKESTGGSTLGSIFGVISGGLGLAKKPSRGIAVAPGDPGGPGVAGILGAVTSTGVLGKGGKAATGLMGVLGPAMAGAGIVMGVAQMFFAKAVERAKKNITKGIEDIADGLKYGTATLGESITSMEKLRQDSLAKYGGSKAGQKALDEKLPEIDQQIKDLKKQAADIAKAFVEGLDSKRAGTGPFGDMYRQLMEFQKTSNDYLNSISDKTSQEYIAALANVHEYYNLLLKDIQTGYQNDLRGFESEALTAQQTVFDLTQSQLDLRQQLADLDKQEAELAKARVDHAKKELDLRKQIADLIRQAAMDEADIRRRGVLEAQLSVAQQKASEIAAVRNKAKDELAKLREQLAALQASTELSDKAKGIADSRTKLLDEIRLGDIRLETASRISKIEGEVTGFARDRFDLVQRQGEIEVINAGLMVEKWKETKRIIESIANGDSGWTFNPPSGFPVVRIQVGDIYINNSTGPVTTTHNNGGGGGGGWGGGSNDDGSLQNMERRGYSV